MIFDVFTPSLRFTPPEDGGFRQKTADLRFAATSIFTIDESRIWAGWL